MLQVRSILDVADNTGAKRAAAIGVLGRNQRYARIGDIIKAHIKEAAPDATVKKGEVVDAVVVATPVRQHFSLGKAALLAGKHVLMEKPMASSTAECEELIALAASRGLTLMVGHIFVYSTAIQMIRKIIDCLARNGSGPLTEG